MKKRYDLQISFPKRKYLHQPTVMFFTRNFGGDQCFLQSDWFTGFSSSWHNLFAKFNCCFIRYLVLSFPPPLPPSKDFNSFCCYCPCVHICSMLIVSPHRWGTAVECPLVSSLSVTKNRLMFYQRTPAYRHLIHLFVWKKVLYSETVNFNFQWVQ